MIGSAGMRPHHQTEAGDVFSTGGIMVSGKRNPADYLKPRDLSTLPVRRGRAASTFYPDLVKAFLDAGEPAMDVDVARIGRKPETVRSALAKAIRAAGAQREVRVSMLGAEVILVKR
jgi:hypothetical protein